MQYEHTISNPRRERPENRSRPLCCSAITRSQIRPTVRQLIRISSQIAFLDVFTASQAHWSSKLRVNHESCRAHATSATTTPCSLHKTLGASASRKQNVRAENSALASTAGPAPGHSPGSGADSAGSDPAA